MKAHDVDVCACLSTFKLGCSIEVGQRRITSPDALVSGSLGADLFLINVIAKMSNELGNSLKGYSAVQILRAIENSSEV
jgi:hypothetical protein